MKGIINFESIWRRSLKGLGLYYKWLFYREKNWPTATMRRMRKLYSQFVREGGLCFDIGANMGSRVGCFLMLKCRVVAVEPQRKCYEELVKVFNDHPVTVIQKGVGAAHEIKDFYVASNPLISSFSTEWIDEMKNRHTKDNWDKVEKVEIVTLGMLIKEYGEPDFIKIDTEGFEEEVLKGLSTPVKALSFEYTLPDPQQKAVACIERVERLYDANATFNICRDEAYDMYFKHPVKGQEMKKLLLSDEFNMKNFGGYGDIYVKKI